MAVQEASNLGFLTIIRESAGYIGGYLITNSWGRPLEFRLSSPVLPNKVQQILYGDALEGFVCADLIGKTLHDKSTTAVQAIITDRAAALDMRQAVELPVAWLVDEADDVENLPGIAVNQFLRCHVAFPEDGAFFLNLLQKKGSFDLHEPFGRVREALSEARKLGAAHRSAA